jgi:hypothetical protein
MFTILNADLELTIGMDYLANTRGKQARRKKNRTREERRFPPQSSFDTILKKTDHVGGTMLDGDSTLCPAGGLS